MQGRKSLLIIVGIIIIVAAVVTTLAVGKKDDDSSMKMNNTTSSQTKKSESSTSNPVATTSVTIDNFAFSPATIAVKVGQTVTWTNNDSVGHTITANTTSTDAPDSQLIGKGETYSFTFKKAGTYAYHCSPHPYMKGTVVVTE